MWVFLTLGLCVVYLANPSLASNNSVYYADVYYPSINWSSPFDWMLLKEYSPNYTNVLISPVSLRIILSLLYQGSAGITQREFESVLHFVDQQSAREESKAIISRLEVSESEEYRLNIGTRVFLDSPLQPQQRFSSLAKDFYNAELVPVNFTDTKESGKTINTWVEKLTNGRIDQLINPDDLDGAIMVIANALYFKGAWRYPFLNKTEEDKFYAPNGDNFFAVPVEFMSTESKFYYHDSVKLDAKILRLPYKGGRYSMFIVLPNSRGGLTSLIRQMNLNSIKTMLYLMDMRPVQVKIPKFKFDFQARFSRMLREFGLIQMFQNTASFPGIVRGNSTILRKLMVSDIVQKSGIEVNEYGSVVYAASELTIGNKFGEQPTTFHATHPFLFYIEEELSGTVLFVGKVENPLGGKVEPLEPKPED